MLAAPEFSYVFLLASGAVGAEPVPVEQVQSVLPISAEAEQAAGAVTRDPEPDPDPADSGEAGTPPEESAVEETPPPYIHAQPVIDSGPISFELSDRTVSKAGPDTSADTLTGDIIIVSASPDIPGDPLAGLNLETFEIAQKFDKALVEPVATAYKSVLPEPIRDGLGNFTGNLTEPVNFVNFLLQGKIGKAAETLGRFAINTTLGVGGILDMAKREPFHLPYRYNGFANTMGFYGVEPGAYLYLPIIGSTTLRDVIGDGLDTLLLPSVIGKPFNRPAFTAPVFGIRALNRRFDFEECYDNFVEDSPDPYGTNRDLYLAQRQRAIDILRGRIPDPLSGDGVVCDPASEDAWDERFEDSGQSNSTEADGGVAAKAAEPVRRD